MNRIHVISLVSLGLMFSLLFVYLEYMKTDFQTHRNTIKIEGFQNLVKPTYGTESTQK